MTIEQARRYTGIALWFLAIINLFSNLFSVTTETSFLITLSLGALAHFIYPKPLQLVASHVIGAYRAITKKYSGWFVLIIVPTILIPVSGVIFLLALPPELRNATISKPAPVVIEKDKTYDSNPEACDIHYYIAEAMIEYASKYPEEAKKPNCNTATLTGGTNHEYTMTGYIISPNAFGVEGRIHYVVKLEYTGGDVSDPDNWKALGDPLIYSD